MMKMTLDVGTKCAMPQCLNRYQGDPHSFTSSGRGLAPVEQLAFCLSHNLFGYRRRIE
ncbi:hypothetical protein [Mycolicibacterium sp.]|uniref:hypothetical protein n=1 Tax=Mycolicibacterium sp. TaxID=2320850 RepID=UPI0037CC1587